VKGGDVDVRSYLYRKYFTAGNIDYIGRVNRFTKQKGREALNSSYKMFCDSRGVKLPRGYRMVYPSLEASFKSASKYDKGQPELDEGGWLLAGEWTKQHFAPLMGGSRVLEQNTVLGEMDMSTSCGYPWNLAFHKKSEMLCDAQASRVLADYWDVLDLPENVIVPIWTCSQKVELRDVEKLESLSHRTFTASPIELSVATNRLCLDMNNRFYSQKLPTWNFVGCTKFLSGWDTLYRRLSRLPHAFELDESAFDASLFARAMYGQMIIRWSLLRKEDQTPSNRRRLRAVYDSIVHSVIVLENGELVQKHTGNPSGSSNTIVDNTMILFRLFAYAWILLCGREKRQVSYLDFMGHVEAALNGDDNTFTVSDECVSWFNPATIGPLWSGIGVTTKTPDVKPRKLSEVRFLSQGFDYNSKLGIWMPVPETERVLSSLYAGSDVDDVRWHYLRASALRLDSYGNIECRAILQAYIEHLDEMYADKLCGIVKNLSMSEIRNVWKSDAYIEALYSGLENESSGAHNTTNSIKLLIDNNQRILANTFLDDYHEQSRVVIMPKTSAAKQRRAAKRAHLQGKGGAKKRGPIFNNPQPAKKRQRKGPQSRMNPVGPGPMGNLGLRIGGNRSTSRRSQVIEEDEYIGEISSTTSFATTAFVCNPGQSGTFPWGNKIAQLYEKYDFEMLEFYYKREVSEYASAGQTGKIILSFDYDASDAAPTTKQQVEDTVPHSDGMPCEPVIRLAIDCKAIRDGPARYVRPGVQPANTDIKTYDAGVLYVSSSGTTSGGVCGELRVRYRVRLSEPVLESAITTTGLVAGHGANQTGNATTAAPLGLTGTLVQQTGSTLPVVGDYSTTTRISVGEVSGVGYLVKGANYLVTIMWNCANANIAALPTLVVTNGGTLLASQQADTATTTASYTSTTALIAATFTANTTGATLTVGGLTGMTGAYVDVYVCMLPLALVTSVRPHDDDDELAELRDEVRMMRAFMQDMKKDDEKSSSSGVVASESDDESSTGVTRTDLAGSVHISRSMASRLSRVLGGK